MAHGNDGYVVEITDLQLKSDRGRPVFSDFVFRLPPGRSAVIAGPPGSGKTLLAELIMGLRRANGGQVCLFDTDISRRGGFKLNQIRRKIGGIGGIFGLVPSMTVAENITFPLVINGISRRVRRERLLRMLTEFSLLKQAGEYPRSLTRVENTMVQFARATIANQSLVIIDEPSAGLDSQTYQRVFDYLIKVALSGRSMLILASERPDRQLPNTDFYEIVNGALA